MKLKTLFIWLSSASFAFSFTPFVYEQVKSVYDGDTILLNSGIKVRYLGIDAPEIGYKGEKSEFMAVSSKDYNLYLVADKKVRLELDQEKTDPYDRLLAYVFLETGGMVNAVMVKHGMASVMVENPNLKYFSLLLNAQRSAMTDKRGIWRREETKPERRYLGSRQSYRFHRPSCGFAEQIQTHNLLIFENRRDAFWEGFSPCKHCRP